MHVAQSILKNCDALPLRRCTFSSLQSPVPINGSDHSELLGICKRIGVNIAPSLDGIPNRTIKLVMKSKPNIFA